MFFFFSASAGKSWTTTNTASGCATSAASATLTLLAEDVSLLGLLSNIGGWREKRTGGGALSTKWLFHMLVMGDFSSPSPSLSNLIVGSYVLGSGQPQSGGEPWYCYYFHFWRPALCGMIVKHRLLTAVYFVPPLPSRAFFYCSPFFPPGYADLAQNIYALHY